MNAVMSMKGEPGGNMSVAGAAAMIHATPPEDPSPFAREIWAKRRKRCGQVAGKQRRSETSAAALRSTWYCPD